MEQRNIQPDNTAVRTALWRAMHLLADAPPHVIEDNVGLQLIAPDEGWQKRPDMDPSFTRRLRASIVARARFIEDLIIAEQERSITQYVILGAGLDTFAQRRPDIAARLQVYEIDQPDTQTWKQQRLNESGYGIPEWLHFVSVNFETSSWWDALLASGFDVNRPAVVVCTGVTLYLTREAITSTLKQLSALAPGSKLAITFYLPLELMDQEDQFLQQIAIKGAREAGTPFISFFSPDEIISLGKETGLKNLETVSTRDLQTVYFSGRKDQLAPASGEIFLLATT
ncbi:methyltransferase (TIGR00027 family) [Chitinophaga terrae (ex Kim and Jung 2007)]|uniref:class I SAM-dependent methyltransferase n=1 Tax=Chitinophaga terrae (ex Kim and Jung 2007) TaxID=408074 RepID=UPI0027819F06|nr:class I SAM-dependent methyltransferase [Chitinophaga terrae (ex Kim and Jung 2007)]MDQ0109838.1 methyltransferase (TIGR00027 family) [Chitinophaga terrae (ex Kim and Jung 2007)]